MKLSETEADLSVNVTAYNLSSSSSLIEGAATIPCPLSAAQPPARSAEFTSKPCSLLLRSPLLVIAYGNTLRRDDGAGIGLAGILVKQWRACGLDVRYIVVPQLAPELTVEIANPAALGVVFVDAAQAEPPLTIKLQTLHLDLATPSISHYLDPAGLLLYAHLLEDYSAPAWVVSVPGVDFGYGEGFSQPVHEMLRNAPQLALEFFTQIRERLSEQVTYA